MNSYGGILAMGSPLTKLAFGTSGTALGEAILRGLDQSAYQETVGDNRWQDTSALRDAGFRSHAELAITAALLEVRRTPEGAKVTAMGAVRGLHKPVPDGDHACPIAPAEIGNMVIALAKLCIPQERPHAVTYGDRGPEDPPRQLNPDDLPVPFGYKIAWIAVPSVQGKQVTEALGLVNISPCSWTDGIGQAYKLRSVFVCPPLDGWTIVVGALPEIRDHSQIVLLEKLSASFGGAFYFATHRIVGYQAWARAESGRVRRAFAYLGERGEFLLNLGDRTKEEEDIEAGELAPDNPPGEETVLEIASRWVLDPREIGGYIDAYGPGWLGHMR